jgi:2-keto-3-deoxy-L-rhamnonate aldolase RhmA
MNEKLTRQQQRQNKPKNRHKLTTKKMKIIALQIETADSIKNMDAIAAVDGVDMLFLGQNDLCMSMGLFETYQFPEMYFSKELQAATDKMISAARKNGKILGLFLFGTDRVAEFIKKGFVRLLRTYLAIVSMHELTHTAP